MNSQKILKIVLVVSIFALIGGSAFADTTPAPNHNPSLPPIQKPQFTAEQQACINSAVKTQQAAMKAAQDTFASATKDALATKQTAMKAAQDTFASATKDALATERAAMKAAQSIKDIKSRTAKIKAANDTFRNNSLVKQAIATLTAAMKAANDTYNNDNTVKQALPIYTAALKAARVNVIQKCATAAAAAPAPKKNNSIWGSIKNMFKKSTSALINGLNFMK